MFFLSLKSKHLRNAFALFVAFLLTVIGGVVYVFNEGSIPASKTGSHSMKAETPTERIEFFRQFGYEVKTTPESVKEVIIPDEFDETYTEYNELQKEQGLDLSAFKGARVKSWSYEILNYPGYENSGIIRGNLLTYKGIVIACDISSAELDGFMEKLL